MFIIYNVLLQNCNLWRSQAQECNEQTLGSKLSLFSGNNGENRLS